MVVGRGQGPAQAANPDSIDGLLWTPHPQPRPHLRSQLSGHGAGHRPMGTSGGLRFVHDLPRTKGAHVGIIGWIILGLIAGAIAKAILPGDDPGGIIVTMLIGVVGAIIGGLIASALDIGELGDFFDIGTWLIAIVGSLLLLALYRVVTRRRVT